MNDFPMTVRITREEAYQGFYHGGTCHIESVYDGRQDRGGEIIDPWDKQINGRLGEIVVAKTLSLPWNKTINTFDKIADVGANEEVRWRPNSGDEMVVRFDDFNVPKLSRRFWLVTGHIPVFEIQGWLMPMDIHQYLDPKLPIRIRLKPIIRNTNDLKCPWRWYVPLDYLNRNMPEIQGAVLVRDPQQSLPLKLETTYANESMRIQTMGPAQL